MDVRLLSDREVARITGRARSTLRKECVFGTGIPFVRIGHTVRYKVEDVELPDCAADPTLDFRSRVNGRRTSPRPRAAPETRKPPGWRPGGS
jgi:hypothetical protein